jgi:superfamily II RNA helicase
MLVEELMTKNLLSAIFATSTVSAGVNFPARTVVIPYSDRFNGQYFDSLTATELAQMTGRAGRRGLDLIGFAIVIPGPFMDLKLMNSLFNSPPDPVKSRLQINFSMVLNLLNAFEPSDIPLLLARSFAAWQRVHKHTNENLQRAVIAMWEDFKHHMDFLQSVDLIDSAGHLTYWGSMTTTLRLEHPLVLYAAVRWEGLPSDPKLLAAILGALLDEKPRNLIGHAEPYLSSKTLSDSLKKLTKAINPMIQKLDSQGFPCPNTPAFSSALAVYHWAQFKDIDKAASLLGRDLGDFVRLILLVSEHLNQLTSLKGQKILAETALEARKIILQEPVI